MVGQWNRSGLVAVKDFAKGFYKSKAWRDCRAGYIAHARGLCELCLTDGIYKPGVIVHHKIHIDADNISDPKIILDWNNLQLVCRDCHARIHAPGRDRRYSLDELGRVVF